MTFHQLTKYFLSTNARWIVLSMFTSIALKLLTSLPTPTDLLILLTTIFAWPPLEWFTHKYLMHRWTFLPIHFTHTRHHNNPTPQNGLPDSWIIIVYNIIPFALFLTPFNNLKTLWASIITLLTIYEFCHFSTHTNYKPTTYLGWAIRLNHLQHHFHDQNKSFAMLFPTIKNHK